MRSIPAIAAMLLSSSVALAQQTRTSTRASTLEAGRADVSQGAYDTGIAKLREAYAAEAKPEILLEIAVAYSQWQGHCQDAITAFDRFFEACAQCSAFATAKDRAARVRSACMVKVKVETTPPGAMISIDGEAIGSSPLEATIIAGQHAFEAELTGYDNPSASQSLAPGQTGLVKLTLTPLPAFVEFQNVAPEATVLISGVPVRPPKMEVQPGRHTIEASRPGFESKTIEVVARRGETARVDLTLDPERTTYRLFMWGSVGVSVFALASTAAFALMASEAREDLDRIRMTNVSDDNEYVISLESRIKSRRTLAIVTGSLSGAGAIAALVFFLIEPEEEQQPEKVAFGFGPEGLVIGGSF